MRTLLPSLSSLSSLSRLPSNALLLALLLASSPACKPKSPPTDATPIAQDPAPTEPSAAPSASSASAALKLPPTPPKVPTMALEPFAPEGTKLDGLFPIQGAIMVNKEMRIGRLVDDAIEWVGYVPETNQSFGGSYVYAVQGTWPDNVDVLYSSVQGRAPQPSVYPLTGKGTLRVFGEGGSPARIIGVARSDTFTIALNWSMISSTESASVRGPARRLKFQTPAQAGCKPGEIERYEHFPEPPAIVPSSFGATPSGTILSLGNLCEKRGLAAEVWSPSDEKSRIVDLSHLAEPGTYSVSILPGQGDEAWFLPSSKSPVLHYRDGTFEALPRLDPPATEAFLSQTGKLHTYDGQTLHRFDEGAWHPVARLAWPKHFHSIAIDARGGIWASTWGAVLKLRETESLEFTDACTTPYLHLYDVNPDNPKKFDYPTTRKALASFPDVAALTLVEAHEDGTRRLGLQVADKAQAEAVIAHLATTMKDEQPKLICYAPKVSRTIEMKKPKGK
ncbi:hypothetical protein [Chondromyces crocatus]|uniref:Uncharacterized protein n=1 Tax=Chondromyces crocatus TaxID=52 RepID=A0A0K1EHN5_CHOCO|nr:hypothetical protein [Chondromyces crocatus]AKT40370.1 uncharacterized protein CMC5_045230 [Chondromyces crocatus]